VSDNQVRNSRAVKAAASVTATAGLVGGLLFLANDAGARSVPRSARSTGLAQLAPTAAPASALQLLPSGATDAQALITGARIADEGTTAAQAVTANAAGPTSVVGVVCPTLLANRALVVSNFAALASQFPAQVPALASQRSAALASISQDLNAFNCAAPSRG